ncbi:MAG TPA: hypothetical protein VFC19_48725 [Candidatus Limnocylindrales bacterium]|nr:hypothetical protein [Candidatus Limnocylindrales bacterium]
MSQESLAEQLGVDHHDHPLGERAKRAAAVSAAQPGHGAQGFRGGAADLLGDVDELRPEHSKHLAYLSVADPSRQINNPGHDVLIRGAGYRSLERFAQDVNHHARRTCGIKTTYDQITVKRWLAGWSSDTPDVVAAVLADAWGIRTPSTLGRRTHAQGTRLLLEDRHVDQIRNACPGGQGRLRSGAACFNLRLARRPTRPS